MLRVSIYRSVPRQEELQLHRWKDLHPRLNANPTNRFRTKESRMHKESSLLWGKDMPNYLKLYKMHYGLLHNFPFSGYNARGYFAFMGREYKKSTLAKLLSSEIFSEFSSIVMRSKDARLVNYLSCDNAKITVIAPTNAAFERIRGHWPKKREKLIADPQLCSKFIRSHIIPGKIATSRFENIIRNTLEDEKNRQPFRQPSNHDFAPRYFKIDDSKTTMNTKGKVNTVKGLPKDAVLIEYTPSPDRENENLDKLSVNNPIRLRGNLLESEEFLEKSRHIKHEDYRLNRAKYVNFQTQILAKREKIDILVKDIFDLAKSLINKSEEINDLSSDNFYNNETREEVAAKALFALDSSTVGQYGVRQIIEGGKRVTDFYPGELFTEIEHVESTDFADLVPYFTFGKDTFTEAAFNTVSSVHEGKQIIENIRTHHSQIKQLETDSQTQVGSFGHVPNFEHNRQAIMTPSTPGITVTSKTLVENLSISSAVVNHRKNALPLKRINNLSDAERVKDFFIDEIAQISPRTYNRVDGESIRANASGVKNYSALVKLEPMNFSEVLLENNRENTVCMGKNLLRDGEAVIPQISKSKDYIDNSLLPMGQQYSPSHEHTSDQDDVNNENQDFVTTDKIPNNMVTDTSNKIALKNYSKKSDKYRDLMDKFFRSNRFSEQTRNSVLSNSNSSKLSKIDRCIKFENSIDFDQKEHDNPLNISSSLLGSHSVSQYERFLDKPRQHFDIKLKTLYGSTHVKYYPKVTGDADGRVILPAAFIFGHSAPGAQITLGNMFCRNGVVHAVDAPIFNWNRFNSRRRSDAL